MVLLRRLLRTARIYLPYAVVYFSLLFGAFMTLELTIPILLAFDVGTTLIHASKALLIICAGMWIWCWVTVLFLEPGGVSQDLCRRGFSRKSIPSNLAHLPLCHYCDVPLPPLAHHCHHCRSCFLRHQVHLSFARICVADRTFKAFFLSFLWGGIEGLIQFALNTFAIIFGHRAFALIAISSASVGVGFFAFAFSLLFEERRDTSFYDRATRRAGRKIPVSEVLQTFGNAWWEWITPLQFGCTHLAWLGVDWDNGK
jgi:hypothetical protein